MSTPTEVSALEYAGNDATVDFPVPFPFLDFAHLDVASVDDATGVATTLVLGVDYTVATIYDANDSPATGTVTTTTAPAAGTTLRIERTLPITQPTSLRSQGAFSPRVHENALDRLTHICQQLERRLAAVESLGDLVPASSYESARVEVQFTTAGLLTYSGIGDVPGVEDTFPVAVPMPAGSHVVGCKVIRARNLTDPTDYFGSGPPQAHWEPNGSALNLLWVSGLDPDTEYLLDLEVLSEEDA